MSLVVEVDLGPGLPAFLVVGLGDLAVQEARERIRAALRNSGFAMPSSRITVNLAPAHLRKQGAGFDLPIALGLLVAQGSLPADLLAGIWAVGELGLDGRLRPIKGCLAYACAARRAGARALLLPAADAAEAAWVDGLAVLPAASLQEAVRQLQEPSPLASSQPTAAQQQGDPEMDLCQLRGQLAARRALEIAVAGGHHLLIVGPPGSGKTLLARCMAGLLPPLGKEELLEVRQVESVVGLGRSGQVPARPFRAPHHSSTAVALVGGGQRISPGEVTLAHGGVLFLDELPEFQSVVLEQLRQPLESGQIAISRAGQQVCYPARFTLVAAANPCPCGWWGDLRRSCRCGQHRRRRYWGRLSGPLLDRFDLQLWLARPSSEDLNPITPAEPTASVRARLDAVLAATEARSGRRVRANGSLRGDTLWAVAEPTNAAQRLLDTLVDRLALTMRGRERLLRVARTIADLSGADVVDDLHLAEAMSFRALEGQESCVSDGGA